MTAPHMPRSALKEVMELFRTLRRQDQMTGIRNSGIALDVCMLMYERSALNGMTAMSVDMISEASGYTGPTVRLVLKRLTEAGTVQPATRMGKTQFYGLTARGFAGMEEYVAVVLAFRSGKPINGAAGPAQLQDPRSDPAPPPARYANGQPDPEGAG